MTKKRALIWLKAALLGLAMAGALMFLITKLKPIQEESNSQANAPEILYDVKSVVDGDTFKIDYDGKETSVRLIGVNTPETVDPRTTVECFGQEASDYLKSLLTGKKVKIEADSSQTDRDKYDRLLRYVYLDGEDVGYKVINGGYGHEYTYDVAYAKQEEYKKAQEDADKNKRGLWADGVCSKEGSSESSSTTQEQQDTPVISSDSSSSTNTNTNSAECNIKGNISSKGEKIYHMPGQKYYNSTKIDTSAGERWFCSEAEAQAAGWRRSKV